MANSDSSTYQLYRYIPSLPAAIIACVVFGLLLIGHVWRMARYQTWFCVPFIIGGLFEFIGYVGRCLSHYNKEALGPYIMQSLLILLGPALFAASIYMTLGRIIAALDAQQRSLVPLRWQTRLFVLGDVFSFLTQSAGGGIQAQGNESAMRTGSNIIVAGLCIQVLFFGMFIVTSIVFNIRVRRNPTAKSLENNFPWQRLLCMLYAASGLILVRSLFRVVEYVQGNNGYLLRNEVFLYVFDAVLMAACMLVFLFYHPSRIQTSRNDSVIGLRSNGKHEQSF